MKWSWAILFCLIHALGLGACNKSERTTEDKKGKEQVQVPDSVEPGNDEVKTDNKFGPLESIKDLDQKIDSYKVSRNLTPDELESNKRLKQEIIRGTFDLYELCHLALDTHWNGLLEKDRNYFVELMTRLLETKAIFSKEQVKVQTEEKPYRVEYVKEEYLNQEKNKSQVSTIIYVPLEKIDLDIRYKLRLNHRGWKIYDVIVDEASLVENYKFQFNTIIQKHGYADLVGRMEKKLKEME